MRFFSIAPLYKAATWPSVFADLLLSEGFWRFLVCYCFVFLGKVSTWLWLVLLAGLRAFFCFAKSCVTPELVLLGFVHAVQLGLIRLEAARTRLNLAGNFGKINQRLLRLRMMLRLLVVTDSEVKM